MQLKRSILSAAMLLAASLPAHALTNLLINGDFQQNLTTIPDDSDFATVLAGSNTLIGWTVGLTAVDLVRVQYGAIDGVSVDLAGSPGAGSIAQSFAVQAGFRYTLTWDYSKNDSNDPLDPAMPMSVTFGSLAAQAFGPVPSGVAAGVLSFDALVHGTASVLFATTGPSAFGPTVDNIVVTAAPVTEPIPEPGTTVLMLSGLAALGVLANRRRPLRGVV